MGNYIQSVNRFRNYVTYDLDEVSKEIVSSVLPEDSIVTARLTQKASQKMKTKYKELIATTGLPAKSFSTVPISKYRAYNPYGYSYTTRTTPLNQNAITGYFSYEFYPYPRLTEEEYNNNNQALIDLGKELIKCYNTSKSIDLDYLYFHVENDELVEFTVRENKHIKAESKEISAERLEYLTNRQQVLTDLRDNLDELKAIMSKKKPK